jgi:hypothetical protein
MTSPTPFSFARSTLSVVLWGYPELASSGDGLVVLPPRPAELEVAVGPVVGRLNPRLRAGGQLQPRGVPGAPGSDSGPSA